MNQTPENPQSLIHDLSSIVLMLLPPMVPCADCGQIADRTTTMHVFSDAVVVLYLCDDCKRICTLDILRPSISELFSIQVVALDYHSAKHIANTMKDDTSEDSKHIRRILKRMIAQWRADLN